MTHTCAEWRGEGEGGKTKEGREDSSAPAVRGTQGAAITRLTRRMATHNEWNGYAIDRISGANRGIRGMWKIGPIGALQRAEQQPNDLHSECRRRGELLLLLSVVRHERWCVMQQ